MIKKKQKGRLPLIKKRGIFKKEGYISIKTNKSLYLKPLHIKAIKLSISYYLGQLNKIISNINNHSLDNQGNGYSNKSSGLNYNWLLTSKHPIFNKSGQRLGGGKSKIKDFYYKIPKNFIILNIKLPSQKVLVINKSIALDTQPSNIKEYINVEGLILE